MFGSLRRPQNVVGKALGPAVDRVAAVAGYQFSDAETKAIFSSYASTYYQAGATSGTPDWSVERAVAQAYSRLIYVWKAIDTLSGDSSSLPVVIRDGEKTVDGHKIAKMLNDGKANPIETGHQLRKRLSGQVLLSQPGAFCEVSRTNGGEPYRLDLLPPHRTRIVPDDEGDQLIKCFEVTRPRGGYYQLPIEDVLWFRNPHILDPFTGSTPMGAMGMSIELDYFARLYNTSFMRNDGKPGGLLAVRGTSTSGMPGVYEDVSEATLNRLEHAFGAGPVEAGKITAISGDMSYQDFGNSPRDMQYGETAQVSKQEILMGWGTPETVMGWASGRTFDNAAAEGHTYWTITQKQHGTIITTGLQALLGEDTNETIELDTSSVEVLQLADAKKREEARAEFTAGLRSVYSYARLAGMDDIEDTPQTRALYIPTGKTPLPSREADGVALGIPGAVDPNAPAGATPGDAAPPAGSGAPAGPADAVAALTGPQDAAPTTGPTVPTMTPADAVAALATKTARRPPRTRILRVVREGETKESARALPPEADSAPLARDLTRVLTGIIDAAVARAGARVISPKARKGTRHWEPEFEVDTRVGRKALDAATAVNDGRVETETEEQVSPLLIAAGVAAALLIASDLTPDAPPAIGTAVTYAVTTEMTRLAGWIATTTGDAARHLITTINTADQSGASVAEITAQVDALRAPLTARVTAFAGDAAHTTITAARDVAVETLSDGAGWGGRSPVTDIRRTWQSRRDGKVRHSHVIADGQEVGVSVPFLVGGHLLRYPRDPGAPLSETAGCRCTVTYLVVDGWTGQVVGKSAPVDYVEA